MSPLLDSKYNLKKFFSKKIKKSLCYAAVSIYELSKMYLSFLKLNPHVQTFI